MSKRLLSLLTIFVVVLSTIAVFNTPLAHAVQPGKYFDNVVTIVMENEGICDVLYGNISYWGMGCGTTNSTYMPYTTSLAKNWTLAKWYNSTSYTNQAFSMKNYLAMISGQTWGCMYPPGDVDPNSSSTCVTATWSSVNKNLVDRLPSSVSWKAYMENMTSNCPVVQFRHILVSS
jgi:hypothetical protein